MNIIGKRLNKGFSKDLNLPETSSFEMSREYGVLGDATKEPIKLSPRVLNLDKVNVLPHELIHKKEEQYGWGPSGNERPDEIRVNKYIGTQLSNINNRHINSGITAKVPSGDNSTMFDYTESGEGPYYYSQIRKMMNNYEKNENKKLIDSLLKGTKLEKK